MGSKINKVIGDVNYDGTLVSEETGHEKIIKLLEQTNHLLTQLLLLQTQKYKDRNIKSNKHSVFLEWTKTRIKFNTNEIKRVFKISSPTAVEWMKTLPKKEFKVRTGNRYIGPTVAKRRVVK